MTILIFLLHINVGKMHTKETISILTKGSLFSGTRSQSSIGSVKREQLLVEVFQRLLVTAGHDGCFLSVSTEEWKKGQTREQATNPLAGEIEVREKDGRNGNAFDNVQDTLRHSTLVRYISLPCDVILTVIWLRPFNAPLMFGF